MATQAAKTIGARSGVVVCVREYRRTRTQTHAHKGRQTDKGNKDKNKCKLIEECPHKDKQTRARKKEEPESSLSGSFLSCRCGVCAALYFLCILTES
jgi:hypothetical protein